MARRITFTVRNSKGQVLVRKRPKGNRKGKL